MFPRVRSPVSTADEIGSPLRQREGGGARDVRVLLERAGGHQRELRGGGAGLRRRAPVLLLGPAQGGLHPAAGPLRAAAQVRAARPEPQPQPRRRLSSFCFAAWRTAATRRCCSAATPTAGARRGRAARRASRRRCGCCLRTRCSDPRPHRPEHAFVAWPFHEQINIETSV